MKFFLSVSSALLALVVVNADQLVLDNFAPLYDAPLIPTAQNEYVVVLKQDTSFSIASLNQPSNLFSRHKQWLAEKLASAQIAALEADQSVSSTVHNFIKIGSEFEGYSARLSDALLQEIRSNPDVAYIEKEQLYKASSPIPETENSPYFTRTNVTWGLQRISQVEKLEFNLERYLNYTTSVLSSERGLGSTVYVVDTGIFVDHSEFEGRAKWGKTFAWFSEDRDNQGHGTHCAGTVGGKRFGVAPQANLVAVKVLGDDGSGMTSWIINGIQYVVKQHKKFSFPRPVHRRSIISMSLGGGYSRAINQAVEAAVNSNVFVVVAAGNENSDACYVSPASSEKAFTIAASNAKDDRAYFSNFGSCTNLFAPGVDVYSAMNTDPEGYWFASGTSMATPHVAGAVAALWSGLPAETPVKELKNILLSRATSDAVRNPIGSPNKLLAIKPKP